jgi:hypothetical protein
MVQQVRWLMAAERDVVDLCINLSMDLCKTHRPLRFLSATRIIRNEATAGLHYGVPGAFFQLGVMLSFNDLRKSEKVDGVAGF